MERKGKQWWPLSVNRNCNQFIGTLVSIVLELILIWEYSLTLLKVKCKCNLIRYTFGLYLRTNSTTLHAHQQKNIYTYNRIVFSYKDIKKNLQYNICRKRDGSGCIILREERQVEKCKCHVASHMENLGLKFIDVCVRERI